VTVDPAFAAVEEAFRENFASRGEAGAAVCVIADGRTVVDLAAGPGWYPDSLVNAFSVGKGLTAAVLGHAMEVAGVALDDPVTRWWPELDLGALGFADPDTGVAFGYVMAEMGPRWQNPRNRALLDALGSCL